MVKIKTTYTNAGKDIEQQEFLVIAGKNIKLYNHFGK
jgi:hypothetical protein